MTVPGAFDVSATGAATYSIPIIVPPGTAGLSPSLSLNYSSQSGNGILGFGWSLGGLPSISRCPTTVAQDGPGMHGSVNYTATDRFCLDGQRLLVVSGSYGADLSEYRTEIDSFSKIIAHNATGVTGPGWFEVHTKSGQILELGNSTDSRILPKQAVGGGTLGVARTWAVSKISDTVGNYLAIAYVNDTTKGQYYPDHIAYTGNATAGVSPYNSVYFVYPAASRGDVTPLYHAGTVMQTTKLLSDIKTYTNATGTGTPVTDYKLVYQLGNASYSQLTSVQRCDGAGACLAATRFTWQTATTWPTRIIVDSTPPLPVGDLNIEYQPIDFNGDGLTDGIAIPLGLPGECVDLYLNTPSGGFVPANMTETFHGVASQPACLQMGSSFPPVSPGSLGDVDGDGLTDLSVAVLFPVGCFCILRNDGAGHFIQVGPDLAGGLGNLDLDGDGRPADYLLDDPSTWTYSFRYTQGDGTYAVGATLPAGGSPSNPPTRRTIGDVDGDGCIDTLFQGSDNEVRLSCNSALAAIPITNPYNLSNQYLPGDFNGDGNGDFITIPFPNAAAILNVSTGTSFIQSSLPSVVCGGSPTCVPSNQFLVGDFDGDGKSDLLEVESTDLKVYTWSSGTLTLAYSVVVTLPQASCSPNCANPAMNGTLATGDVDGDGCTDLIVKQPDTTPATNWYYKFGCHPPLLMTGISNGIGATTTITYDRLNKNQPLYTKCPNNPSTYACGDAYPILAVDGPIYVVAQVDTSNGIGGVFTSTYAYSGAKKDLSGRDFLGFEQVAITHLQTNVVQTTSYNMLFPYTGTVTEEKTTVTGTNGTVVLSDTVNSYGSIPSTPVISTPTFVYLKTTTTTANEVDGTALPTSMTSHMNGGSPGYDAYGNPTYIQTTVPVPGGSTKTTNNVYSNNASTWIIGRLINTTVTSVVGSSSITRTSSFGYLSNGVLKSEIIEPGSTVGCNGNNTSCTLDTEYPAANIDAFGHPTVKTVSGVGFTARTTSVGYDANGEFVISATNATTTQTEHFDYTGTYGMSFGVPTGQTDLNGLVTSWSYDSFGRRINETLPGANGPQTDIRYDLCGGPVACPTNGAFVVQTTPYNHGHTAQNGPITKTYYDALSRVIAVDVQGFDGPSTGCTGASPCWIRAETNYDANGYVGKTSRPYFLAGGTAKWTTNTYTVTASGKQDPYGRIWNVTNPDLSQTNYAYTGLGSSGSQTTVTNALTQATVTTKNAQGLVASVTNALSKTTSYIYDAYGDLLTVTDPAGNQIVNTYDIRGNKLTSTDPDMGSWSYVYDALSELTGQTDAKSQATTLVYDPLGRMTSRTEPDQTSTWTYDTAAHGIGFIKSATGSNAGYERDYFYDSQERPSKVKLTVNGTDYLYIPTYNTDSRIDTLTYPSGLVVKYAYTALGYLQQLKDNASGTVLWTANVRDAEMHLTDQSAGNHTRTISVFDPNTGLVREIRAGKSEHDNSNVAHFDYVFDTIGNLSNRSDTFGPYAENFCYDGLNRLTAYSVGGVSGTDCHSGTTSLVKTAAYNDIGNLTNKSDLANTGTGNYGYLPGQPHAVISINGTVNGIVNPHYNYDANGNMTCEYTGINCSGGGVVRDTETYWASNMPNTLTQGTTGVAFVYDSEHARVTQAVTTGSSTVTTTYLNDPITGMMSERVMSGGTPTWNDYLMADGKLLGERSCTGAAPCSTGATTEYFVLDHLGSVSVVTDGTSGAVTTRESFDAWGRQRNADGSDDPACALGSASPNTRRFTSQEHIDTMCLINLNARIYDPTIGRFMVADSVVPDPYDDQSYNRYTYTDNRPLSFTDPTGHADTGFVTPPIPDGDDGSDGTAKGKNPPHGTGSDIHNMLGIGVRFWTNSLEKMGARNISVTVNSNGNLALNFTCSGGDSGCVSGGRAINSQYGGGEFGPDGETVTAVGVSYTQGDVQVATSRAVLEQNIRRAIGINSGIDGLGNAATGIKLINSYFGTHQSELPEDLRGKGEFKEIYKNERGPYDGAGAFNKMQKQYGKLIGMENNTIYLFAGSSNSVEDAVRTMLHEIGHHTPEAFAEAIRNNKPEAEDAADKYMDSEYSKVIRGNRQ